MSLNDIRSPVQKGEKSKILFAACSLIAGILLDTGIMTVFFLSCFSLGFLYVDLRGILYLLVFIGATAIIYRNPKQTAISLGRYDQESPEPPEHHLSDSGDCRRLHRDASSSGYQYGVYPHQPVQVSDDGRDEAV